MVLSLYRENLHLKDKEQQKTRNSKRQGTTKDQEQQKTRNSKIPGTAKD
jgi:hypothetical protein